jgi:type II secretory pathway pseudopilin PulG
MPSSRAFTFIEVLFAIIILGVGMIMVAALLPVAIQQTAQVKDDVVSRTVAENAQSMLRGSSRLLDTPGTPWNVPETLSPRGPVVQHEFTDGRFLTPPDYTTISPLGSSFRPSLSDTVLGDRVFTSDPRFAWFAFHVREGNDAAFRVLVSRIRQTDTVQDYLFDRRSTNTVPSKLYPFFERRFNNNPGQPPVNGPHLVRAVVIDGLDRALNSYVASLGTDPGVRAGPTTPDFVVFVGNGDDVGQMVAEEGAFIVLADFDPRDETGDTSVTDPALRERHISPANNIIRVFRLGRARPDMANSSEPRSVWELDPAADLASLPGADGIPGTGDDIPDQSLWRSTVNLNDLPFAQSASFGGDLNPVFPRFWILGRGLRDPNAIFTGNIASSANSGNNPFLGQAQDLFISDTFNIPSP